MAPKEFIQTIWNGAKTLHVKQALTNVPNNIDCIAISPNMIEPKADFYKYIQVIP